MNVFRGTLSVGSMVLLFLVAVTNSKSVKKLPGPDSPSEQGYGLMYSTNTKQFTDVAVSFNASIPEWLTGTYVKNGMGLFEHGPRAATHAGDGMAKLSSWKLNGTTTALFSTRMLNSHWYRDTMSSGTIAPYGMFKPPVPPFNTWEKLMQAKNGADNFNVNVYFFPSNQPISSSKGGDYAALSDYWKGYTVNIDDLSVSDNSVNPEIPDSRCNFPYIKMFSSAHPLPEPGTNNTLEFLVTMPATLEPPFYLTLARATSYGRRTTVAQWPVDKLVYMHSFSVTQTKVMILVMPVSFNISCITSTQDASDCIVWEGNKNASLYVVDLKSGKSKIITMENVFTLHHINAYDVGEDGAVFDVSTFESSYVINKQFLSIQRNVTLRENYRQSCLLKRYKVNVTSSTVTQQPLDVGVPSLASQHDFPVINENYRSKHYCWAWGVAGLADNKTNAARAIVKKDFCKLGTGDRIRYMTGHYPYEPWFVPTPGAKEEDDGVLLVAMIDGQRAVSYIQVLNATSLDLMAHADLPTWIPFMTHGRFFPRA